RPARSARSGPRARPAPTRRRGRAGDPTSTPRRTPPPRRRARPPACPPSARSSGSAGRRSSSSVDLAGSAPDRREGGGDVELEEADLVALGHAETVAIAPREIRGLAAADDHVLAVDGEARPAGEEDEH